MRISQLRPTSLILLQKLMLMVLVIGIMIIDYSAKFRKGVRRGHGLERNGRWWIAVIDVEVLTFLGAPHV